MVAHPVIKYSHADCMREDNVNGSDESPHVPALVHEAEHTTEEKLSDYINSIPV
jgi:hypothetical protein